ncbi:Nn.00g111890.m01.CDS01 [Neocucurbitaria sp. VM-36]
MLNVHPTSPPMTPGPRTQNRYPPQTHQTSPLYKRMGIPKMAQTPPLEFIEPTGQGHHFKFTRPQSLEPSSRPSTPSVRAYATTSEDSEDDDESEEESQEEEEEEEIKPMLRAEKAHFVLEELDSDPGYDSDIEVVLPDHYEDAKSDRSGTKSEVFARLKELALEEDSSDEEERERKYRQKKKRWSAGIFKRSHSQSVEGDSSYSDNDPLDDVDPTARRLRRRVRGPCDRRGSLIFEDRGFSNTNNIVEVEEPEEGRVMHSKGPPSIPSDDAFTLDELPFWRGGDLMDVEFDSD